jgi:hypothetical protein
VIDGINVTESVLLGARDLALTVGALGALGVKRVRMEIPGSVSLRTVDTVVTAYRSAGIEPLMILGVHGCSGWTAYQYGEFCKSVALRYGPSEYEIWNEPNLHLFWARSDTKKYVSFLKAAYDGIKSVSPSSTVVFGGLAACATTKWPLSMFFVNKDPLQFVKEAFAAGAKGYFDEMGYHPYPRDDGFNPVVPAANNKYLQRVKDIRTYLLSQGVDKPLRLTEWGFGQPKVAVTTASAQVPVENAILNTYPFVSHSYLYCLRDGAGGDYGVFTNTWQMKQPYYDAVKALIA